MNGYDERTALIVVDMQNDFADPGGSLYVKEGDKVASFVNEQIDAARSGGGFIVFTQDWHPPNTPHFEKDGGIWPVHCVGGTWGAEIYPEIKINDGDRRVRKGVGGEDGYSGFTVQDPTSGEKHSTELESLLRSEGIQSVVVIGLATDYCVKATAIDAAEKGFSATVLLNGVRAVDLKPGDGETALKEMQTAGVTVA